MVAHPSTTPSDVYLVHKNSDTQQSHRGPGAVVTGEVVTAITPKKLDSVADVRCFFRVNDELKVKRGVQSCLHGVGSPEYSKFMSTRTGLGPEIPT